MKQKYDLEDRLLEFSLMILQVVQAIRRTAVSRHLADQLLRAGTSPYGNHGEAEAAESRDDFVHKLKICHKELREARRWLRLIDRAGLVEKPNILSAAMTEADELVRIFFASIRTAAASGNARTERTGGGNAERPTLNA